MRNLRVCVVAACASALGFGACGDLEPYDELGGGEYQSLLDEPEDELVDPVADPERGMRSAPGEEPGGGGADPDAPSGSLASDPNTAATQPTGDCCVEHEYGHTGCTDAADPDNACQDAVCAEASYCCETHWSSTCAWIATQKYECSGLYGCPEDISCGNGNIEACEVCDIGDPYDPTDDVLPEWKTCQHFGYAGGNLACAEGCGGFDFSGCWAGECCTEFNGSPGCEDAECTTAVCAYDPWCCEVTWDDICAYEAAAEPACVGESNCPVP